MTLRRTLPLLPPLLIALAGCAGKAPPQTDHDPWQRYNRKMFAFNDWLDRNALEPIARGWDHLMPDPVERGVANFFDNLRFPANFLNSLLQGDPHGMALFLWRLQINTVTSLGFYDLADRLGLPPERKDFGQTLGLWGIAPGPYLVLPLLGPSSPRDTVGLVGDFMADFYQYFVIVPGVSAGAAVINVVNERARLLDTVDDVKNASLDYYVFVRNAYVQRRWKLIHDRESEGEAEEDLYDSEVYEDYLEDDDAP